MASFKGPLPTADTISSSFFGSAGQEPNVPAPRICDENPFWVLSSGLTGIWVLWVHGKTSGCHQTKKATLSGGLCLFILCQEFSSGLPDRL